MSAVRARRLLLLLAVCSVAMAGTIPARCESGTRDSGFGNRKPAGNFQSDSSPVPNPESRIPSPESQRANRRVYEGVVDLKQKTIGTIVLMEINGGNVTGWMRLVKFVPIESGTVTENSAEFRAGGNTYKIDERKGRITYSGPDGAGDRIVSRLTPLTGVLDEMIEGERFSGTNIAVLDVNGRSRRFNVAEPSLWKRQGPPFEKFGRLEELLQRKVTFWVAGSEQHASVEVVEEPDGMDIPLKAPKKPKEKKKEEKKK